MKNAHVTILMYCSCLFSFSDFQNKAIRICNYKTKTRKHFRVFVDYYTFYFYFTMYGISAINRALFIAWASVR